MATPQLSPSPAHHVANAPDASRSRNGRALRRVVRGLVVLAVLLAVSAGANAALSVRESLTLPYGQRITIPAGKVNTAVSGTGEETFVIMPGYGSASPVLEFGPLIDALDDAATVVVVEPFGYGWSDRRTDADRTVENMSTELHQTLAALQVRRPYTLVAHSIGALYALDYVNRFPAEVRAVVSIDGSVPIDEVAEGGASRLPRLWTVTGVSRWVSKVRPTLFVQAPEAAYPERSRQQIWALTLRNDSTSAVVEEGRRTAENVAAVKGLSFPAGLPVLTFLAQDSIDAVPEWYPAHRRQLDGLVHSRLVVIDDGHYLHYRHSAEIAATARAFLDDQA